MSHFRPDFACRSVTEIEPGWLRSLGIEGLLIDIDNTLTRWESAHIPPEVREWLESLRREGLSIYFLSNGRGPKRRRVEQQTGVRCVTGGVKPLPSFFRAGLRHLNLPPEKVAMIGDMVFTDIWVANRLGMTTILVDPISRIDFPVSKLFRLMEWAFRWRRPKNRLTPPPSGQGG